MTHDNYWVDPARGCMFVFFVCKNPVKLWLTAWIVTENKKHMKLIYFLCILHLPPAKCKAAASVWQMCWDVVSSTLMRWGTGGSVILEPVLTSHPFKRHVHRHLCVCVHECFRVFVHTLAFAVDVNYSACWFLAMGSSALLKDSSFLARLPRKTSQASIFRLI